MKNINLNMNNTFFAAAYCAWFYFAKNKLMEEEWS